MNLVVFSHGKESGPQGTKIALLSKIAQKLGYTTISIDYRTCKDADERVTLLHETLQHHIPSKIILVGSSMGGYVSTVVASELQVAGLFLMCPALYLPRYSVQNYAPQTTSIEIIHGWEDDIVPVDSSIQFGQQQQATLHLTKDNHRLSHSHELLQELFYNFLKRLH